ncbi:MAG: hypothetical protein KAS39_03140, partial [Actinomycetia bacterium]|nr:hypothetical protein [Actinomycetes bacterium]
LIVITAGCISKSTDPEKVFWNWHSAAQARNYSEMFKYEQLNMDNVIYCYETILEGKWENVIEKDRKDFINNYYVKAVKKALQSFDEKNYHSFLRTDPALKLEIESYEVKKDIVKMWLVGDFSGDELIKMQKSDDGNTWNIINPLGYHSYIPTRKHIREMMDIPEK